VANVSYLRPGAGEERSARRLHDQLTARNRRGGPGRYVLVALAAVLVLVVAGGVAVVTSSASITVDGSALARVNMPFGGGTIESVFVTKEPTNNPIRVVVRGHQIWPRHLLRAGEQLSIDVVVKRPGLISWLTGSTEHVHLTLTTPRAEAKSQYLTLRPGAPLRIQFDRPVKMVAYGQPGAVRRHLFAQPQASVDLPRPAPAGSELVAATPRTWETTSATAISWFPAGAHEASAVANPAPGTKIGTNTPITLTFSRSVSQALGGHMPPVNPDTAGTWHQVNDHTITFDPEGYGYGLGATVTVPLPAGVQLVGAKQGGADPVGTWSVPGGTTLRLQQLLSILGYLPVTFRYAAGRGVGLTPAAQEQAALDPPAGTFAWRFGNTPDLLRSAWQPGAFGTVTQGAIMAFENDQGLTTDGAPSAAVWNALIQAVISGKRSTFGYTFVRVSEGSPETEQTWHNGRTVVSGPVNTGIPSRPTALGLYPVFEHALSVTMSGTNPDGSHYSDPGVPYVSYFNGGDALHGFIRGSYGFPQSLGCVEMPYSEASSVYPYTPIGTLVDVT
jgi:peptidoglycan hydrolase-like protein with peptidoglycan-binding domain